MKLFSLAVLCLPLLASAHLVGDYEQAATEAKSRWGAWSAEQRTKLGRVEKIYKPFVSRDNRVLVWVPKGTKSSKLIGVSKKAVLIFDKLFDPKAREASAPAIRTAALFPLSGPKSFQSITNAATQLNPALGGWASAATSGVGFLLEDPLAAGWLLKVPNSEVWNVENELVNRLARLLTIERYGRQPHWLAQGLAWHVELKVCKDVYCFPYRTGFVSKKEHKSWAKRLPLVMKARGERQLTASDLHSWSRASWQADSAALASGAVDMLAKHYPAELPRVLSAFAQTRTKDGRKTESDGSWQLIPNYEIPADKEQEILNRELGVDFLAEFDRYARAPGRYRRPRK
jgi:hypothetical protein